MSTAAQREVAAMRFLETSDVSCVFAGHSGARVTLYGSGARAYVRKLAGTTANNERLMRQAEKQRLLSAHGMPFPRILGHGIDEEGLAYFDMEYAPGRTVADAVTHSAVIDRPAMARALGNLLWLCRLREGDPLPAALFHAKIDEIAAKCAVHDQTFPFMAEIREAHSNLSACDWSDVPQSPCHGDLTLENIILTRKRGVVFIDCDDPWVSSWWLDIAKLFQDTAGHWCLRDLYNDLHSAQLADAQQMLEQIAGDCRNLATDSAIFSRLPQLIALNLFRCLPYVRRAEDARFVCARIRHVMTS
jgi:aminoglycoside phosphotransferase